jgi:thioredoxin 2
MTQSRPYLFRCPSCRTKNRIPTDKAGVQAKCGKCGLPMDTRSLLLPQPVIVSDGNFEEMVLQSPIPVLLDCWATWCQACSTLSPIVQELGTEWKGRVRVGKLNVEANPILTARYDLRSLPTLLIFDKGELRDTLFGAVPKLYIIQKMAPYF